MSKPAIERLQMRQTQQRNFYQQKSIDKQSEFDRATPPLTSAGYEADCAQAIVGADGSEVRVTVHTNGAIEQGTSVAGTLTGGIDARPRPRRSQSRSRSSGGLVALLFQAQTKFAYANDPPGSATSRFYLKLNRRVLDLGQYWGSTSLEKFSIDGHIWPPVIRIVTRPRRAVIVQLATTEGYERVDPLTPAAVEDRYGDLWLHTWIAAENGSLIASDHQILQPAEVWQRHIFVPLNAGVGTIGWFRSPFTYPDALLPYAADLVGMSEPFSRGGESFYRLAAPANSIGKLHDQGFGEGSENPDASWGYFFNWAQTSSGRLIRIRGRRNPNRSDLSLSDLYAADGGQVEVQTASAAALNEAMRQDTIAYEQSFRRSRVQNMSGNFFADFPIFAEWGMDANTVPLPWYLADRSDYTIEQMLNAGLESGIDFSRLLMLGNPATREITHRFRLLSGAAL